MHWCAQHLHALCQTAVEALQDWQKEYIFYFFTSNSLTGHVWTNSNSLLQIRHSLLFSMDLGHWHDVLCTQRQTLSSCQQIHQLKWHWMNHWPISFVCQSMQTTSLHSFSYTSLVCAQNAEGEMRIDTCWPIKQLGFFTHFRVALVQHGMEGPFCVTNVHTRDANHSSPQKHIMLMITTRKIDCPLLLSLACMQSRQKQACSQSGRKTTPHSTFHAWTG